MLVESLAHHAHTLKITILEITKLVQRTCIAIKAKPKVQGKANKNVKAFNPQSINF